MSLDPLTAGLNLGRTLIDKIWPDPAKQSDALLKLKELEQKGDLAELNAYVASLTGQLDINKVEAAHPSLWVAGWRPFVGWVCGFSLAYAGILEPFLRFIVAVSSDGWDGTTFPLIDTWLTVQILTGMLGLGALRSKDKADGVATTRIASKLNLK
jgi:hypothetical protein